MSAMMRPSIIGAVLLGVASHCLVVPNVAPPATTSAPELDPRWLQDRADGSHPNILSVAQVLLTAMPASLRMMALTNFPQASSVIWSEFLDGKRPDWFTAIPSDVQTELIDEFSPTTSTSSSSSTSSVSTSSSGSSRSSSAVVTSFVTVSPDSAASSENGLSAVDKAVIGLSVALAVLLILGLLLAICLLKRRRRWREKNPLSRSPTPASAFLTPTEVPKPTTRPRAGSRPLSYDGREENPFADPPPIAAVGAAGQHNSSGSLASVPEVDEHDHGDIGARSRSGLRRSRGSSAELKHGYNPATMPVDQQRHSVGSGNPVLSPLNPAYGSDDWHNQHPALRNSMSGPYPNHNDSYNNATPSIGSIRRKPVGGSVNHGSEPYVDTGLLASQPGRDSYPQMSGPNGQHAVPRQDNWPFHRNNSNNNSSSSGSSNNSHIPGYWKVHRPNYERYEQVHAADEPEGWR